MHETLLGVSLVFGQPRLSQEGEDRQPYGPLLFTFDRRVKQIPHPSLSGASGGLRFSAGTSICVPAPPSKSRQPTRVRRQTVVPKTKITHL